MKNHGRVSNRDIARETDASPNTLKFIFSALVKKGLLIKRQGDTLHATANLKAHDNRYGRSMRSVIYRNLSIM